MTITPPTIPGVGIFPGHGAPFTNITPFTYRSGEALIEYVERLRQYVANDIAPYVDGAVALLVESFVEQVGKVIADTNEALTLQATAVDAELADMTTYINGAVASIINSTIAVSDPVIAGVLDTPAAESVAKVKALALDKLKESDSLDFLGFVMAPISPMRYGAHGDGTGDDTLAVQQAISAAQSRGFRGGPVSLKSHSLTGRVNISGFNITLEGDGGTLRGGGIRVGRNTSSDDIYTRIENVNIDMVDKTGDAVVLENASHVWFDNINIKNALHGFFVPPNNVHQHVRRVFITGAKVENCKWGWFSDQPEGVTTRYTVGDLQLVNSQFYANETTMFAHGIDGLNMSAFKSFQRQSSTRKKALDFDFINFAMMSNVNLFEPGEEGLLLSRFQNFHWNGGNVAWAGQLIPSHGIYLKGGTLLGNPETMSSFTGISIQRPTYHGFVVDSPVDYVVIDPSVSVQGSGDTENYYGPSALMEAIPNHYGFYTNSNASKIRAFGTTWDRANVYPHGGEFNSMDSLRVRNNINSLIVTDTRTSLNVQSGISRVTVSQPSLTMITLINDPGVNGQELTIYCTNGLTKIQHGPNAGPTIRLKNSVDVTIPQYGMITLYYTASNWVEKSRNF